MKRGEIFFAALDFGVLYPARSGEIQKTRPVVVVSNNVANRAAAVVTVVTVVPLTTSVERVFPFEVLLAASATGLSKNRKAMAQQVRTVDKARLNARAAGAVQADDMLRLDAALKLHLGLHLGL